MTVRQFRIGDQVKITNGGHIFYGVVIGVPKTLRGEKVRVYVPYGVWERTVHAEYLELLARPPAPLPPEPSFEEFFFRNHTNPNCPVKRLAAYYGVSQTVIRTLLKEQQRRPA